jgi:hypothetical protein
VRHLDLRVGALDRGDLAGDPAEPGCLAELEPAVSPLMQAPNEPTPGNTIRCAPRTSSGSSVTAIRSAPAAFSALWTDWRLPAP